MKPRLTPTEIVLKDLPVEGRDYDYSNETAELNEPLKDLIGKNPYHLHFHLQPMGNTFDLRGQLTTKMDLHCASCGNEFQLPLHLKLHEFLLIEKALGKGDQTTKNNHAHEWENDGPDYIVLSSDMFNVAEYAHEAIGLAEPIRPLCAPELPEGCAHKGERPQRPWLTYDADEKTGTPIRANPFQVLEKMKLKS